MLYESPRFSMMSLFFCDHTQGQPGRKKGDDCSSHSAPGRPAARLGWNTSHSQLLTAPLLNTREPLPVETLVLFYCRGPLSTFLPTCSALLDLDPSWASLLDVLSPLPTFGALRPVSLTPVSLGEPCRGGRAGGLAVFLTWAWRDQSGVPGLARLNPSSRILGWALHTFRSLSPTGHLLRSELCGFDFHAG